GVRLHVGRAAGRGVERVAEPSARIQGVPALLEESGIELEEDLDAADAERVGAAAVLVEHVPDLDAAVELVVGLIAEAEDESRLDEAVLLAAAVVAGRDLASAAEEGDGSVALLGDSCQGGRRGHDEEPERERSHAIPS